ncbi:dihydrolipoyl dehydrogenase, mitochondrial [Apis mellifera caucasica]|uniref:Dihydrolipoyl dehydrogenase n=1 Tax=Apis mellifera TaxID=7460 RepID=A0A7M7MTH1_APIME|nr:dihydrolipoyl dehydrogenase, mitochondrial [Apis mellifera]KAG6804089.1 dihydrolipoyl dehydrogenase, mitochondrial [Apis mellifera caucasica]KAG9437110.1 dihydrolipoyl dehydrogenase, mitochondrial [Apis mellifera carnica]|eukprot:XP_026300751.1 dihydrolipoyl dehydrogenase, mitochondrial [Apis mellifera]
MMQACFWSLMTISGKPSRDKRVVPGLIAIQLNRYTTLDADLVVIGGGPGGYVASIKASQLGMKTICIEKEDNLGGTCLNTGCIPSKFLLHNSNYYNMASNKNYQSSGITVENVKVNVDKCMQQKQNVIRSLANGIVLLYKKNKINWVKGHGKITNPNQVTALNPDGSIQSVINSKRIMIATGSEYTPLTGTSIDEKDIISSTGALSLSSTPTKFVTGGAGFVGLEMGSVWQRFGSDVTTIDSSSTIGGPNIDKEVSQILRNILTKQGIKFKMETKVTSANKSGNSINVSVENINDSSKKENISCNTFLICVGRRPYTHNLGLESVGIKKDNLGRIPVNSKFQTEVPTIYAIGDCIRGPMLAHKAEDEAVIAVENITGGTNNMDYNSIPHIIYTYPEVAWVGKTEETLKQERIDYKVGKFPNTSNSRARTNLETDGFVKVLADKRTDKILGVHMISSFAGELINEAALAVQCKVKAEDVARTCHAHPTYSEAIKEACLTAYFGKPINL